MIQTIIFRFTQHKFSMDSQILLFHRYKGDCVCCAYKPILKLCCFIGLIPVNFHCNHHNHPESRFTYKVSKLSVLIAIFVVLYLLLAAMKVTIHVFEQTNIFDVMISLSFVIIVWSVLTTYCFVVISYRKVASLVIKTLLDFHNCFIQTENTTSKNLIKTARRKSMVYVILITIWVPISTLIACATIENLQNALLIISADFIFQLIVFVGISYIDVHVAAISYLYKNILSKIDAKIRENERINLNFRQIRFIYKNIFDNQSFFNKFISIIFCVYVPAASMIVIIGFCGINEMIETNFHLSLFILITFWFIDAIVAIIYMLVAEDLHEKSLNLIGNIYHLTLTKLSFEEIQQLEQLIISINHQPVEAYYFGRILVSRKLIVNIISHGFTYFIVYLQFKFSTLY